jgi:hypothetical protein
MIAWIVLLLLNVAVVAAVWWRSGPRRAVAVCLFLTLLTPEWIRWDIAPSIWINVRVAAVVASLCLYLLHPKSTYNFKLVWADYAMLGLVATHVLSDTYHDGFHWSLLLRAYGEWVLPYLAGRVAIQVAGDAKAVLPWAMGVATVIAGLAVAESVFQLTPNPYEFVFGPRQGVVRDIAIRSNFKRAYGPTMEPLFFAVFQFLLLPWMIYGTTRTLKGEGMVLSAAAPLNTVVGVLATLSRGPYIAMVIVAYVMQLILYPSRRLPLAVVGVFGVVVLMIAWNPILNALESVSGESRQKMKQVVNGKEVRATSTYNRLNLFAVYDDALRGAGFLGYGTARCSQFPPRVPLRSDPGMAQYVDNAFLLYTLRFGYLGLLFFLAANVAAAYQFVQLALRPHGGGVVWATAMAGTVVGMMFLLCTVFMAPDFGFLYLFTLGTASGIWAEHLNPLVAVPMKPKHRRRRRRHRTEQPSGWDEPQPSDLPS